MEYQCEANRLLFTIFNIFIKLNLLALQMTQTQHYSRFILLQITPNRSASDKRADIFLIPLSARAVEVTETSHLLRASV